MARKRSISPGFFKNEYLAECSIYARMLFAGLWCYADRDGRLEYRPKRLKSDIYPYEDCDIDQLCSELASRGFVTLYEVNDVKYLQISNFAKHQSFHKDEKPCGFPSAPLEHGAGTVPAPLEHGASTPCTLTCTNTLTLTDTRSSYSNSYGDTSVEGDDRAVRFSLDQLEPIVEQVARKAEMATYGSEVYKAAAFFDAGWLAEADLASIATGTRLNGKNKPAYFQTLLIEAVEKRGHSYGGLLKRCSCQGGWPTGPPSKTAERLSHQDFPTIGAMDRDDEPTLA